MIISLMLATTLHFAGDSTLHSRKYLDLRDYPIEERALGSWCDELEHFLKPGNRINNLAFSGCSTKSFIDQGRWAKLIATVQPGDFVYLQFGHNDQKSFDKTVYAPAKGLFSENLTRFAAEIRAKGASPIFGTPMVRRFFTADGKVDDRLEDYPDTVRRLGEQIDVPVVDFNAFSRRMVETADKDESLAWYRAVVNGSDMTHPTKYGAKLFARAFRDEVKRGGYAFAELLRDEALPKMTMAKTPFGRFANWSPTFPNRIFRIGEFGAKADGSDQTSAFADAIAAAHTSGGGRVIVPKGKWTLSHLAFKSNVELHLEEGAVLDFLDDPSKLPVVETSWEGIRCLNVSPLVYGIECDNIALTGPGKIEARMGTWIDWYPRDERLLACTEAMYHWGATNATMAARRVPDIPGAHLRPQFVQFNRCRNILIEDVAIRNSPFWTVHLLGCENCTIRGISIYAHGHNNDGIDIEMSRDVLIEACHLDTCDDGICCKAGRNADGWNAHRPTERVLVRNVKYEYCGSICAVGSELSGGVRDVWVTDCTATHPYRVFGLKTNRRRGGFAENIWFENIKAGPSAQPLLSFATKYYYEWARLPDYQLKLTPFRNVNLRNVQCESAKALLDMEGDDQMPLEGLRLENVHLEAASEKALFAKNVRGIDLKNVTVGSGVVKPWVRFSDWIQSKNRDTTHDVPKTEAKPR